MKGPGLLEISPEEAYPGSVEPMQWSQRLGSGDTGRAGSFRAEGNKSKATKLCDAKCSVAIPDLPQARGAC